MDVREPTPEEVEACLQEAKSKGLPDNWTVAWDKKGAKVWVYQKNGHKEYTIPKAIAYSVKIGILGQEKLPASFQPKTLSEEEKARALQEARLKGLPESFDVKWDNSKKRRVWITPDGRQVKGGIKAAIEESVKLGLLPENHLPPKNLSKEEQTEQAMKEAKARGLPEEYWKVIWDEKSNQRLWVFRESGREFNSVAKALTFSVKKGFIGKDKLPSQFAIERELTPQEEEAAWKEAKKQGLPETWKVKWDNKQNRRIWISPDGVGSKPRRCDCISKAINYSVKMGLIDQSKLGKKLKESLTRQEEQEAMEEAKVRGLPDGWSVKWNSKKSQKQWHAPNGRICNSIPDALKLSVKLKLIPEMPPKTKTSRKRKQTKIISKPVVTENSNDLKQLVDAVFANPQPPAASSEFKAADTQETIAASGFEWIGKDEDTQAGQPGTNLAAASAAMPGAAEDTTTIKAIPTHIPGAAVAAVSSTPEIPRVLTQEEIDTAMEEATARGLPDGWTVSWDSRRKRRSWSYGKTKCKGIPSAIEASKKLGLLPMDFEPPAITSGTNNRASRNSLDSTSTKDSTTTKEQREEVAMKEGKERGLPDGWRCEWNEQANCRKWISPDNRICKGISEALAMSVKMGLLPEDKLPEEYRERDLTQEEQARFLAEAKAKGLPNGFSVGWNARRRQKLWISPDGKTKYDSIPKALAACARMGLVPRDQLSKSFQDRELSEEEKATALEQARAQGLPEGWTVEWNSNKGCRRWRSPDGSRNFECISKAVAYSVKTGLVAPEDIPTQQPPPKKRARKSTNNVTVPV